RYREEQSKGGVPIGSASGLARNLPAYRDDPYLRSFPEAVLESPDFEERYYQLLVLALARDVTLLAALNPSTLLTLFSKAFEWVDRLARELPPGPAEKLRAVVRANGRFLPTEMWPSLKVVQTWKGGAAMHYLSALREA